MFVEDIIAGAILVLALAFTALAAASYARTREPKLAPVLAVLLVLAVKNVLVILDALWGTFGGALGGYTFFAIDIAGAVCLLAVRLWPRGGKDR